MDLNSISLEPIRAKTVAILGYGNQGRAQALNLRDSGVQVRIGARPGNGARLAEKDGFTIQSFEEAVKSSDIVMYLFPDQTIPQIYEQTQKFLKPGQSVGFAHGFCYHFKWIEPLESCRYFLVGSKGAGAVLRDAFERGSGLPGVYALDREEAAFETLVQS
ncbi:MAG: NAD(P)-binding domain-containing protein, partial [Deltaproteobacteria bacterium]